MDILLMGLCVAVIGVVFVALAFGAAMRSEPWNTTAQPEPLLVKAVGASRFFSAGEPVPTVVPPVQVPIEVLLLQIENHVRLEQAAAESFLAFPSQALLHSKTTSPFVN
jgi:hypothetical protein